MRPKLGLSNREYSFFDKTIKRCNVSDSNRYRSVIHNDGRIDITARI